MEKIEAAVCEAIAGAADLYEPTSHHAEKNDCKRPGNSFELLATAGSFY